MTTEIIKSSLPINELSSTDKTKINPKLVFLSNFIGQTTFKDPACRDIDPEVFFPIGNGPATRRDEAIAKEICNGCPEKQLCLDSALELYDIEGVRGGRTGDERERILRIQRS